MNRKFNPNRQGITLLFVVSMIVLFLLMGTAFVIVSNDFNRASNDRIRSNVIEGKGSVQPNQLLEEAMYQIIRGTELGDPNSPLRTNDILADAYGYGIKSFVSRQTVPSYFGDRAFIQLALNSDPNATTAPDNSGFNLLTFGINNDPVTGLPMADPLSPNGLAGTFGGRVLTFTSGPAKGFSARIVADAFNDSGALAFRIPTTSVSGDVIDFDPADIGTLLAGSEVIINGRDFSGLGAAVAVDGSGNPLLPLRLTTESQRTNRVGQSHAALIATYLNSSNSVNEPWDAADIATPFLSGFTSNGVLIPSSSHRSGRV